MARSTPAAVVCLAQQDARPTQGSGSRVSLGATLSTSPADRALLLGLPALSVLAAFALPTLQRSLAALIDWFTLLFFSLSAIAIWVVWLSLQTGWPAQPAANVARLAPGFTHSLAPLPLLVALGATLAWCALVRWRVVRHRTALWKSLVLPAAGTTLAWLLLMTIWLPPLDYARSYAPQVRHLRTLVGPRPGCLLVYGMSDSQVAALQFHGNFTLRAWRSPGAQECQWLAVASERGNLPAQLRADPHSADWSFYAAVGRPTNRSENIISKGMLARITATGVYMSLVFLLQYKLNFLGAARGEMTTVLFTLFVLFQLFNAFNCRELHSESIFCHLFKNKLMLLVVGCTFVLQVLIIQFAGAFFGTVPLGIAMWGKLFALAFSVIVLSEVIKVFARLFQKKKA
jgi:hypothetical protein